MASNKNKRAAAPNDSPPDLQILGDEITLQPSGYFEPSTRKDEKEEALMEHMARFRSEPLQYVPSRPIGTLP
jgi:hypothetical protein